MATAAPARTLTAIDAEALRTRSRADFVYDSLRDAISDGRIGVGERVRFVYGDLFEADISAATVVTLFLLPGLNERLIPKFRRELRQGTRIVSHHFGMGEAWPPEQSQDVNGLMIYLWTIR